MGKHGGNPGDLDANVYRVVDWAARYEHLGRVAGKRPAANLAWIAMGTAFDEDYVTLVTGHDDGPSHMAVGYGLVRLAARCDPRGVLLRANREPYDPASMSRMVRLPEKLIVAALPRLVGVGWLEEVSLSMALSAAGGAAGGNCSAGSSRKLSAAIVEVLKRLGMTDEDIAEQASTIARHAAVHGGTRPLADKLHLAVKADCTNYTSAMAWVREMGWSEGRELANRARECPPVDDLINE